jgi:hypothetical protein
VVVSDSAEPTMDAMLVQLLLGRAGGRRADGVRVIL